ncbi:hypothetical protein [Streptomyces fuscigenes]|uniref:hypothetical protein n=1 Tax=Streptomyces fuscigenes TaxID=1528880 RepID=UPI001F3D7105|nr:hypothetical protein [Streptomyces fuscigenes]MCF3964255.1 hypothetical protein [Streptomyces fuscigenes]
MNGARGAGGPAPGPRPWWNAEAQRWEDGTPVAPYGPPPPPLPSLPPRLPGGARVPGAPGEDTAVLIGPGAEGGPGRGARLGAALRARRGLPAAAAGVVLLGAIAAGSWLAFGTDAPPPRAGAPASPHPSGRPAASTAAGEPSDDLSEDPDPSGTDGASPSATAGGDLPDGIREVHDAKGFTTAVPEDWTRSEKGASVYYTSPDGASLLQIFTVTEKSLTPEGAARAASEGLSEEPGYDEISLGRVPGGPENPAGDAAELVYSYDSAKTGGVRQGVERVFTAVDGAKYAVLVAAPQDQVPLQDTVLGAALSRFAPDGPPLSPAA